MNLFVCMLCCVYITVCVSLSVDLNMLGMEN